MSYTIEKLLAGDPKIVDYYKTARSKWEKFFAEHNDSDLASWSDWLTMYQTGFEQDCGGRWVGQEIMVWSGFGSLYTTAAGFDKNQAAAIKLAKAFAGSMCSIEVKSKAQKAADSYCVEDSCP